MTTHGILVLYVPVLHSGYLKMLKKYQYHQLYLLHEDVVEHYLPFHKEIRALESDVARRAIDGLGIMSRRALITIDPSRIKVPEQLIIMVDDELSRKVAGDHWKLEDIKFENVFLRWDETSVRSLNPVEFDRISSSHFDQQMMALAAQAAEKSADWWRQVGAVLVRDGDVLLSSRNKHVPSEIIHYVEGDPRDFVKAGTSPEVSTALHCEQEIITTAAREGISLKGCELYVTVFPCPMCAKQIAYSGIRKCYFASGHASLQGERLLKSQGVELIYVQ